MPFGLTMKTRPFAASLPRIEEGSNSGHAIKYHRIGIRLHKLDEFVDVNAEPLPIDDGLIGQLVDVEGLSVGLSDDGCSPYHSGTGGHSHHRRRQKNETQYQV